MDNGHVTTLATIQNIVTILRQNTRLHSQPIGTDVLWLPAKAV